MTGTAYVRLEFVMPLPANIANARRKGWRAAHFGKQRFLSWCDERQRLGVLPAPPQRAFDRVTVSAKLYMPKAMDDDNAFLRASKWPMDWLKSRGYITNDAKRNVQWLALPEQIISRKEPPRVELTLTPVES